MLAPSASARNHVTSNIRYPTPTRHSTRSPWSSYQASGAPTAPTHSRGNGGPTAFDDSDLCSCDVMGAARAGRTGGWSVGGELTLGFIASPLPTIVSCLSVMPRSAVSTLVIAPCGLLRRRGGRNRRGHFVCLPVYASVRSQDTCPPEALKKALQQSLSPGMLSFPCVWLLSCLHSSVSCI